jgi:hypothetical protein
MASSTAIVAQGQRALQTLKNYRQKVRLNEQRTTGAVIAIAGGGVAGAVDAYFDEPKLMGIPATPVVASALLLAGLFDAVPGGLEVAEFGKGALSYAVGSLAFKKVNGWEE